MGYVEYFQVPDNRLVVWKKEEVVQVKVGFLDPEDEAVYKKHFKGVSRFESDFRVRTSALLAGCVGVKLKRRGRGLTVGNFFFLCGEIVRHFVHCAAPRDKACEG